MLDKELIEALRKEAENHKGNQSAKLLYASATRLDDLNALCAELYQVIGVLADKAHAFETTAVEKALDNALAGANGAPIPHQDLLPFKLG